GVVAGSREFTPPSSLVGGAVLHAVARHGLECEYRFRRVRRERHHRHADARRLRAVQLHKRIWREGRSASRRPLSGLRSLHTAIVFVNSAPTTPRLHASVTMNRAEWAAWITSAS